MVGIDLFAGAGGMSLGAAMAGIDVCLAIEKDPHSLETYKHNHTRTKIFPDDIRNLKSIDIKKSKKGTIIFGGPPCKGFSTSNQRTRNPENESNWLFLEFLRIVELWMPDWVVFENVRGIKETASGVFLEKTLDGFKKLNYETSLHILNAADYGVPQKRNRLFIIASLHGVRIDKIKSANSTHVTVGEAIHDLPNLPNGADFNIMPYKCTAQSDYAKSMRNGNVKCSNHLTTKNSSLVIERYKHIPQGGNWENIPTHLMENYENREKCHTGIYHRLKENQPSVVIGNFRKNMLIHPKQNRGLSVREAARLQSFPDWYEFMGSIGFQQQQVGNAVPPLLAGAVFSSIS